MSLSRAAVSTFVTTFCADRSVRFASLPVEGPMYRWACLGLLDDGNARPVAGA